MPNKSEANDDELCKIIQEFNKDVDQELISNSINVLFLTLPIEITKESAFAF